jgi:hypothetical protein
VWGIGLRAEYLADPDHYLCNAARAPFGIAGLCQAAGIVPTSIAQQIVDSGAQTDVIGQGFSLLSGTLTLEALPVEHLIIRLDTRIDHANADVFVGTNEQQAGQVTATLGVVATTD